MPSIRRQTRTMEDVVQAMSLRLQLLLLQALIVCLVTVAAGVIAVTVQERSVREAYRERMVDVAQQIARLPAILDAFDDPNPSVAIQPIAELIRESSNLTYVVVTDEEGIRFSHPDESRIGEKVSTDPSAPLSGEIFVGTQTGTLGTSWRVKVPVYADGNADSEIIGSASVGVLESELAADVQDWVPTLLIWFGGAALVGVFAAAGVTAIIRRRLLGLEPKEIAELVDERETTLHRLSEGLVRVDGAGLIISANDAAGRLLGRDDLVGAQVADVLEPAVLDVLERGEPEGRLVLAGERAVIARGTGMKDDSGRAVGGTLLLRDHTELHSALREMDGQQSLTDGLRAQAHEFANSMHVITGLLELDLVDEARDYIARSQPGGALGIDSAADGVGAELAALLSVKDAQARERGIALSVDATGTVPSEMSADLITVVGNLVDNAFDACGAEDRVGVVIAAGAVAVAVTVDDTGPGVPEHLNEKIFDEGVSTKGSTARARGIGLALVRRVVRRRRGSVVLSASPSGGARFTVTLPISGESS